MKIGFIGAGRVGFSLGKYLVNNNINVIGYYSKDKEDTLEACDFTNTECYESIKEIVDDCDTLFLTSNDDSLEILVNELIKLNINNKILIHTSGAKSSLIFDELNKNNYCYSLHPIYAFNDKYNSYKNLDKISFTLEGNIKKIDYVKSIFSKNKIIEINIESKIKYHLACVFMSNFITGLISLSSDMLSKLGIDDFSLFKELIINNVNNTLENGIKSLTGPIRRNDLETINDHLNNIDKKYKNLYIELSKLLINFNVDNIDYNNMIKLLEEQNGNC